MSLFYINALPLKILKENSGNKTKPKCWKSYSFLCTSDIEAQNYLLLGLIYLGKNVI